jgi:hypothetical protein
MWDTGSAFNMPRRHLAIEYLFNSEVPYISGVYI